LSVALPDGCAGAIGCTGAVCCIGEGMPLHDDDDGNPTPDSSRYK